MKYQFAFGGRRTGRTYAAIIEYKLRQKYYNPKLKLYVINLATLDYAVSLGIQPSQIIWKGDTLRDMEWYNDPEKMNPDEDYNMDLFSNMFDSALDTVATMYATHRNTKEDSWKGMSITQLRILFGKEWTEYAKTDKGSRREYHEVQDVILVGLMLLTKLGSDGNKQ